MTTRWITIFASCIHWMVLDSLNISNKITTGMILTNVRSHKTTQLHLTSDWSKVSLKNKPISLQRNDLCLDTPCWSKTEPQSGGSRSDLNLSAAVVQNLTWYTVLPSATPNCRFSRAVRTQFKLKNYSNWRYCELLYSAPDSCSQGNSARNLSSSVQTWVGEVLVCLLFSRPHRAFRITVRPLYFYSAITTSQIIDHQFIMYYCDVIFVFRQLRSMIFVPAATVLRISIPDSL